MANSLAARTPWRTRRSATSALIFGCGMLACVMLLGLTACGTEPERPDPAPTVTPAPPQSPTPEPAPEPAPEPEPPKFDLAARSIDDPDSIWVIANKLRQLNPADYTPSDLVVPTVESTNGQPLRHEAAEAVERLTAAAAADGIPLRLVSAFRSYDTQVSVYGNFVSGYGQAFADTTSARPGHSEHQTGLTADFDSASGTDPFGPDACMLDTCFAETPAGQWLYTHAADYGFIERYPAGLEDITGYHYEPWHYRYVGPDLAHEMRATGTLTLEEVFGLPAAPSYAE